MIAVGGGWATLTVTLVVQITDNFGKQPNFQQKNLAQDLERERTNALILELYSQGKLDEMEQILLEYSQKQDEKDQLKRIEEEKKRLESEQKRLEEKKNQKEKESGLISSISDSSGVNVLTAILSNQQSYVDTGDKRTTTGDNGFDYSKFLKRETQKVNKEQDQHKTQSDQYKDQAPKEQTANKPFKKKKGPVRVHQMLKEVAMDTELTPLEQFVFQLLLQIMDDKKISSVALSNKQIKDIFGFNHESQSSNIIRSLKRKKYISTEKWNGMRLITVSNYQKYKDIYDQVASAEDRSKEKMLHFILIPNAKIDGKRISILETIILGFSNYYFLQEGRCNVGNKFLADQVGCSIRTVTRTIAKLQNGWLRLAINKGQRILKPDWRSWTLLNKNQKARSKMAQIFRKHNLMQKYREKNDERGLFLPVEFLFSYYEKYPNFHALICEEFPKYVNHSRIIYERIKSYYAAPKKLITRNKAQWRKTIINWIVGDINLIHSKYGKITFRDYEHQNNNIVKYISGNQGDMVSAEKLNLAKMECRNFIAGFSFKTDESLEDCRSYFETIHRVEVDKDTKDVCFMIPDKGLYCERVGEGIDEIKGILLKYFPGVRSFQDEEPPPNF